MCKNNVLLCTNEHILSATVGVKRQMLFHPDDFQFRENAAKDENYFQHKDMQFTVVKWYLLNGLENQGPQRQNTGTLLATNSKLLTFK